MASLFAAFWTDAGTKEILDFCSVFAAKGFRALLKPRPAFDLPGALGLSAAVGGAEIATDKVLFMNSVPSIFITAVFADFSSSNSTYAIPFDFPFLKRSIRLGLAKKFSELYLLHGNYSHIFEISNLAEELAQVVVCRFIINSFNEELLGFKSG